MTRLILLAFVRDRLANMVALPSLWASRQEAFIAQLVLLAEISHLGTPEPFALKDQTMLAELSGPDGLVTPEWATQAVQTARKYVLQ